MKYLFAALLCVAGAIGWAYQQNSWVLGYPQSSSLARQTLKATGLSTANFSHVTQETDGQLSAVFRIANQGDVTLALFPCDATLNCAGRLSVLIREKTDRAHILDVVTKSYATCLGFEVFTQDVGVVLADLDPFARAGVPAAPVPEDTGWTVFADLVIGLEDVIEDQVAFEKSRSTCATALIGNPAFTPNPPSGIALRLAYNPQIALEPDTIEGADSIAARAKGIGLRVEQTVTVQDEVLTLGPLIGHNAYHKSSLSLDQPSPVVAALDAWLADQPNYRQHALNPVLMYVIPEMRSVDNTLDQWRMFVVPRDQEGRPAVVALTYVLSTGEVRDIAMVYAWDDPALTELPTWPADGDLYLP